MAPCLKLRGAAWSGVPGGIRHLGCGEAIAAEVPDGGVLSNPMWQHRVENVGETEIHAVIVELKEG